jgi:hypothetical protein
LHLKEDEIPANFAFFIQLPVVMKLQTQPALKFGPVLVVAPEKINPAEINHDPRM